MRFRENPPPFEIRHNRAGRRFEAVVAGQKAVAEYEINNDHIAFTHTYVPPDLRGQSIAEKLVRAGLAFARTKNLTVIPACSYVDAYIKRHQGEYGDLLVSR